MTTTCWCRGEVSDSRDQYKIVLDKHADDIIIDRHEANGVLFDKYFLDEAFQAMRRDYLAGTYASSAS